MKELKIFGENGKALHIADVIESLSESQQKELVIEILSRKHIEMEGSDSGFIALEEMIDDIEKLL